MNTEKIKGFWYPNDLKPKDVNELKEWQLLLALVHFSKSMRDCVDLDYGYKMQPKWVGKDEVDKIIVDQTDKYGQYIDITEEMDINNTDLLKKTWKYQNRLSKLKRSVKNDWKRLGKLQLRKRLRQ